MNDISLAAARREMVSAAFWLVDHIDGGAHHACPPDHCTAFAVLKDAVTRYNSANLKG